MVKDDGLWNWSGKMPYKDRQKRIEYKRRWNKEYYRKHKKQEIERVRKRKTRIKEWLKNYKKELSCSKCGENHPACLEFHHLDKTKKDFIISGVVQKKGYSKTKIMSEIEKCIVLCANCHKKLHSKWRKP